MAQRPTGVPIPRPIRGNGGECLGVLRRTKVFVPRWNGFPHAHCSCCPTLFTGGKVQDALDNNTMLRTCTVPCIVPYTKLSIRRGPLCC